MSEENLILITIILAVAFLPSVIRFLISQWSKTRGDLIILPEKTTVTGGDVLKGKVLVNLKQPIQANGLNITMVAERKVRSGKSRTTKTFFTFTLPLGQSSIYTQGEYAFEFMVPKGSVNPEVAAQAQAAGGFANLVYWIYSRGAARARWYLRANLDIPNAIDMNSEIEIQCDILM